MNNQHHTATKSDINSFKLDTVKWLTATAISICGIIIVAIKLL